MSTFSAVLSLKTDVSTAPLFNIVKVLSYKTDDSTVLLFYTAKALSGSRFEDRRPCYCTFSATAILHCEGSLLLWYPVRRQTSRRPGCCYRSISDLLPPIYFANALRIKQHCTCCRSCHTTLSTLSTTCCCYCCCCTSIAINW